MASYTSSLIVNLIDKVSAPSRAIKKALEGLNAAQQRNNRALNAARGRMIDATMMGFGLYEAFASPTRAAVEFESKLEDIAQKVDVPVSALGEMGKQIKAVALDTTQSTLEMAKGMDVLAGMGANRDDSLVLLKPIGRAAFAYTASIEDLSQASYAALDNLKVPANQLGGALDAMAEAGKAGAFELKDMAQYFPILGSGYQSLGQSGVPAVADLSAALQIVRKGAGDSASAATNLANVLQKMNAPLTQKNFAKMGVNLQKELKKASKLGMSPIEAIAEITNRTLKGDMSKLGDLFNDAQVQQGMRPLIQNIQLYRDIRKQAMEAQGVVEEDYQRRLQTGGAATARFKNAIENVKLAFGNAFLPVLKDAQAALVPLITGFGDFIEKNPGLTRAIVLTTAAIIGLRVATLAGQYGWLLFKGGLLSAQTGLLGFVRIAGGGTLAPLRLALMGLTNPIGLITKAFGLLRIALMGSLIGGIVLLLAMAGVWIYNNWEGVSTAFIAFKDALLQALSPVMPLLQPVIDGIKWVWEGLCNLVGPVNASKEQWAQWGTKVGQAVGDFIVYLMGLGGKIINGIKAIYNSVTDFCSWLFDAGKTAIASFAMSIWNGIKAVGRFFLNLPMVIWNAIKSVGNYLGQFASWFLTTGLNAAKWLSDAVWNGICNIVNFFAGLPGRILTALGNLEISKSLGIDGVLLAAADMANSLGGYITGAVEKLSEFRNTIIEKGGEFLEAGKKIMYQLWDGIKSVMGQIVEYIKSAISNAASSALSKLKGFFSFGSSDNDALNNPEPKIDGARASGGPVRVGSTYLVGEKGPELFTAPVNGVIHNTIQTKDILRNQLNLPMQPRFNVPEIPPRKVADASLREKRSVTVNLGGISINVPQTQNLDIQALAAKITQMIGNEVQKSTNAAFSDGVY